MKIAIFSDIHDRLDHLSRATFAANSAGCARLLFLGDFCAPFSLKQLAEEYNGTIDAIFGNNDGDQFLLCKIASDLQQVTLHGQFAQLEIDNRDLFLTHYPEIAQPIAKAGEHDAVFFGHNHIASAEHIGDILLANPGEIMGRFGPPTIGIYDTDSNRMEHVEV